MVSPSAPRRIPDPVEWIRRICRRLPGTLEVEAWGHPTFRVAGRTFAAVEHYKRRPCIAISADLDEQDFLIEYFGFFKTPYVGSRGWVSVWVDEPAPVGMMADLLKRAHHRLSHPSEPTAASRGSKRRG